MTPLPLINRREILAASTAALAITGNACAVTAEGEDKAPLLARDFTVAVRIPSPAYYIHDPGMAVLPSGRYVVAAPIRRRHEAELPGEGPYPQSTSVLMSCSDDRGASWQPLPTLRKFRDATPFVHNEALYLLIPDYAEHRILLLRSDDEGKSWSDPSIIMKDRLWNCQTAMAQRDGRLYWALTAFPGDNALAAISANLAADLMDPGAWRVSAKCDLPTIPESLKCEVPGPGEGWYRPWDADTWLEPNVVNVNGRLRVLVRIVTGSFATTNLAAVCEIDDAIGNSKMQVEFKQFHPLPGGQCKFFIVFDEVSQLFWMLSNIPTDSQDLFERAGQLVEKKFIAGPGNERRILTLHYGVDALNWFPAGVACLWPSPLQAFMYPSAAIDGDDLIFISRTSQRAPNQHDADRVTFHRIAQFRALAVGLRSKY
jgi:hypothetical protein